MQLIRTGHFLLGAEFLQIHHLLAGSLRRGSEATRERHRLAEESGEIYIYNYIIIFMEISALRRYLYEIPVSTLSLSIYLCLDTVVRLDIKNTQKA